MGPPRKSTVKGRSKTTPADTGEYEPRGSIPIRKRLQPVALVPDPNGGEDWVDEKILVTPPDSPLATPISRFERPPDNIHPSKLRVYGTPAWKERVKNEELFTLPSNRAPNFKRDTYLNCFEVISGLEAFGAADEALMQDFTTDQPFIGVNIEDSFDQMGLRLAEWHEGFGMSDSSKLSPDDCHDLPMYRLKTHVHDQDIEYNHGRGPPPTHEQYSFVLRSGKPYIEGAKPPVWNMEVLMNMEAQLVRLFVNTDGHKIRLRVAKVICLILERILGTWYCDGLHGFVKKLCGFGDRSFCSSGHGMLDGLLRTSLSAMLVLKCWSDFMKELHVLRALYYPNDCFDIKLCPLHDTWCAPEELDDSDESMDN